MDRDEFWFYEDEGKEWVYRWELWMNIVFGIDMNKQEAWMNCQMPWEHTLWNTFCKLKFDRDTVDLTKLKQKLIKKGNAYYKFLDELNA